MAWVCLAGTAAAVPAAFLTTPIDVVKTRVQAPRPGSSAEAMSGRQHLAQVLEEGGYRKLLTGALPRVVRTAPQFGITLLVYEATNSFFQW